MVYVSMAYSTCVLLVDGHLVYWMHRRSKALNLHSCKILLKLLTCFLRLYQKGRVLGHKRGKRNTRPNTSLIQIEGVANKEEAQFYLGKVCYVSSTCL